MTVLMGAMDGEISDVIDLLAGREVVHFREYAMTRGEISGKPVLVAKSGVGKTYSAMLTQRIIDMFEPERLIFTGLAGSINPSINIGDMLVARDCMQHDLDATAVGFRRGEFPYENIREMPCDEQLVDIASTYEPPAGSLHLGRVLTGDQFLDRARLTASPWLRDELDGDVVEMEGASVAAVCRYNGVRFLLARTVSDKADSNARVDFERFLAKASANSSGLVSHIMARL